MEGNPLRGTKVVCSVLGTVLVCVLVLFTRGRADSKLGARKAAANKVHNSKQADTQTKEPGALPELRYQVKTQKYAIQRI